MPRTISTSASDHRIRVAPIAGTVFAAAGLAHSFPALAGAWPALRAPLGIEQCTLDGTGCALTFDDGPHRSGTPAVLDVLEREQVTATFFMVGEQVRKSPALAREVAERGHRIALHCDRHRNLLRLAAPQVREDLARAADRIFGATDRPIGLYRPPYGISTGASLILSRSRGWRTLLWTHWGKDWQASASAASIAALATSHLRPGSVVLLHDADDYGTPGSWRKSADALPAIIDAVRAAGLQFSQA